MNACSKCDKPIHWRRTVPNDKAIPLDPDPTFAGNVVLVGDRQCRVLSGAELVDAREEGTSLYKSHFATCPEAKSFRKPEVVTEPMLGKMDAEIRHYEGDAVPPPPAEKAIGAWRCRCGLTMMSASAGRVPFSVSAACSTCGDEAEVLPA